MSSELETVELLLRSEGEFNRFVFKQDIEDLFNNGLNRLYNQKLISEKQMRIYSLGFKSQVAMVNLIQRVTMALTNEINFQAKSKLRSTTKRERINSIITHSNHIYRNCCSHSYFEFKEMDKVIEVEKFLKRTNSLKPNSDFNLSISAFMSYIDDEVSKGRVITYPEWVARWGEYFSDKLDVSSNIELEPIINENMLRDHYLNVFLNTYKLLFDLFSDYFRMSVRFSFNANVVTGKSLALSRPRPAIIDEIMIGELKRYIIKNSDEEYHEIVDTFIAGLDLPHPIIFNASKTALWSIFYVMYHFGKIEGTSKSIGEWVAEGFCTRPKNVTVKLKAEAISAYLRNKSKFKIDPIPTNIQALYHKYESQE
jgi:hypothetical protein